MQPGEAKIQMSKMNFPRQKEEEEGKAPQEILKAGAGADADGGFFEFFKTDHVAGAGPADQMSAAEDIFHPWKRLQQHAIQSRNQNCLTKPSADHRDHTISLLKRAASLNNAPTLQKQQHMDIAMQMPRRAQSARNSNSNLDSPKVMNIPSSSSRPNPKWYLLMFGSMKKMAGEMDMRDIRRRQNKRRNVPVPTPPLSASKSRRKLLLRGFSCKEDHTTAVANVSLGCIPHI